MITRYLKALGIVLGFGGVAFLLVSVMMRTLEKHPVAFVVGLGVFVFASFTALVAEHLR